MLFTFVIFITEAQCVQPSVNNNVDSLNTRFTTIEPDENYILFFKFDSLVHIDKCPCTLFNNNSKKCRLIKGKVTSIIFKADSENYFMSKNEILQTNYILVSDERFSFYEGQILLISAYNSPNKKYLIYNRTRNKDENKNYIFRYNLIQSPVTCYKFSLLRWLRINKKPPTDNDIKVDKIGEFISKYND